MACMMLCDYRTEVKGSGVAEAPDRLSVEMSHGKHQGLDADDVLKQPRLAVSP